MTDFRVNGNGRCPLGLQSRSIQCRRAVNLCGRDGTRGCTHNTCPDRNDVIRAVQDLRRKYPERFPHPLLA